jgi:hypothetical protein
MAPYRLLLLTCTLFLVGCGSPEDLLTERWVETSWSFEKSSGSSNNSRRDGIRMQALEGHRYFRHEAEYWRFHPDRTFEIKLENGEKQVGRWRLKGRGHVLTLRYASGHQEAFDVRELNENELVLHAHAGMEARSVARLIFKRATDREAS